MNENRRFARSASPSPIVFATRAAPPVPSMNPMEPSAMASGNTRFTAASASLPAKFDTNRPSTTLYMDVNIIMAMEGSAKRTRRP